MAQVSSITVMGREFDVEQMEHQGETYYQIDMGTLYIELMRANKPFDVRVYSDEAKNIVRKLVPLILIPLRNKLGKQYCI